MIENVAPLTEACECMACESCGPNCPSEETKSHTLTHAELEFKALGYIPLSEEQEDGPNKWIQENVMELLKVFANQGHSGSSAPFCVDYFEKLAMHKPLTPLTGEDWEWVEVGTNVFQNKRLSKVFKQPDRFDGQAYDIEGKIFWNWYTSKVTGEKFKSFFSSGDSFVPIEFPYTPNTEYIEVDPDWECECGGHLTLDYDDLKLIKTCIRCGKIT